MGSSTKVLPVIMSGGSGTRLWPLSTEERPKQFHALASEGTMIQETARRFGPHPRLEFLSPLIVCNQRHGAVALAQLQAAGVAPQALILEPFGRNTASVAVMAAAWAAGRAPDALVLLLPADHVVRDGEGFRAAVERAAAAALDHIVTFGIEPAGPETGFGYIQGGAPLYPGAQAVARFVEKPDRPTAEAYLSEGGYFWNAGIFLFTPELFLMEARRHCPGVLKAALAALEGAVRSGPFLSLDPTAFQACPSLPIDTAVMEKTDKAAVVPCDIGWADVGSWSELWRQGPLDDAENLIRGEVFSHESHGSLIWTDGPKVAALGLTDMIVIATGDHVMVLPKSRAQDVKAIVDALKKAKAQ